MISLFYGTCGNNSSHHCIYHTLIFVSLLLCQMLTAVVIG